MSPRHDHTDHPNGTRDVWQPLKRLDRAGKVVGDGQRARDHDQSVATEEQVTAQHLVLALEKFMFGSWSESFRITWIGLEWKLEVFYSPETRFESSAQWASTWKLQTAARHVHGNDPNCRCRLQKSIIDWLLIDKLTRRQLCHCQSDTSHCIKCRRAEYDTLQNSATVLVNDEKGAQHDDAQRHADVSCKCAPLINFVVSCEFHISSFVSMYSEYFLKLRMRIFMQMRPIDNFVTVLT